MKPSTTKNNNFFPYILLFVQPIFMATNIIVARGGVEYLKKEFYKLFFLGLMGCGVCGAFPFIAGMSTTMANMGIIYTSSPVFIVILSVFLFSEKISLNRIVGLIICLIGVITIITKGNFNYLINFSFTTGDFWMLGAAIGWALYSIYLFYWKSDLEVFPRFTLIAFFGAVSLLPFSILEENYLLKTNFDNNTNIIPKVIINQKICENQNSGLSCGIPPLSALST